MGTPCETSRPALLGSSDLIFVTVGTQLAFDRMVSAVDRWAERHPDVEFFAQIGPSDSPPKYMPFAAFIPPTQTENMMHRAEIIVSHAGMGSLLTALRYRRPIIIMPRKAGLGEHRNDHQMATARWMEGRPGVVVAWDETTIGDALERRSSFAGGPAIPEVASGPLVERLARFIHSKH
jgi:UDP-N-acetylglucosamine transferase subunit ALG13